MLVYLAGPYTKPDPAINTRKAILLGAEIRERFGVRVYVPHLSHFEHLLQPQPYERWLEIDLQWVAAADVVCRMAGASDGADAECRFAHANKIPIVSVAHSLDSLADFMVSRRK